MNHSIQMEGGFFERLMIALDTLPPRLLRVARFVEDHRLATAFMGAGDLTPAIRFARYSADRVPLLRHPHQPGHRFVFSDIRVHDGPHRSPQSRRGSQLRGETIGDPENETAGQQQ